MIPNIDQAIKLIVITLDIGIWVTGLGKLAIGITILRIIGNTSQWQKWTVWVVMILTLTNCIADFSLNTFRCGNPQVGWTVELWPTANCISETAYSDFNNFSNAVQVFADFTFSLIPMAVVWRLRMSLSLRRRIYLVVALGLTLVTGAVGTVKMVHAATLDSTDLTWSTYPVLIWFGTEAMLIVVCGSVPALYPLYERYIKKPQVGRGEKDSGNSNSRSYVNSGSIASGWSKVISKLRSKKGSSFGSIGDPHEQRSTVELARFSKYPLQPLPTATTVWNNNPGSWMDDCGDSAIRVVRHISVDSGRSRSYDCNV